MISTLSEIIEYADRSNVLSKHELKHITRARLLRHAVPVSLILLASFLLSVQLAASGLLIDAYAGLVLTGTATKDYLDKLHSDSLAPEAIDETHSEKTKSDLKRTTDHVIGLLLLVTGFLMQLPSALT